MASFNDVNGKSWAVDINVGTIKRVRSLLDFDLLMAVETDEQGKPAELDKLIGDPVLLVDVLFVICQEQAQREKVSDEDFGRSLSGQSLEDATDAFVGGLLDFFPPAKTKVLRKVHQKAKMIEARGLEQIEARIDSGQLDKRLEAELSQALKQFDQQLVVAQESSD